MKRGDASRIRQKAWRSQAALPDGDAATRRALDAVRAAPADAHGWLELGRTHGRARRFQEAFDALVRAVALAPDRDEPRRLAALAARELGQREVALVLAIALRAPRPDDLRMVPAAGLAKVGFARALPFLERLAAAHPEHAEARHLLGLALFKTAALARALPELEAAVRLDPRHAPAWNNLGNTLKAMTRLTEAHAAYERAVALREHAPDPSRTNDNALRNLLFALQYDPDVTMDGLLAAHRRYGARYDLGRPRPSIPDRDPERRLRVGYVSADFGAHPVGYFMLPVFAHHDRTRIEVVAYAGPRAQDEVGQRLRATSDRWVPTGGLSDRRLAERIAADRIDVLVDLGGHTRGSRVRMFGLRPAPVQVTWAGYVGTTGLASIDWLLGDARHTPDGFERWTVERVWRLPRSYVCWEPPATPEPGPLPMRARGAPTLACMNNMPKINDAVLALWASILAAAPHARLLLGTRSLGDDALRERVLAVFDAHGVARERVTLSGHVPREELLRRYRDEVDLALDPFPYSGGLTTLEALHEGVPVITLGAGERFASRHARAHIGALGRPDVEAAMVAPDVDAYRALALRHLAAPEALAALRRELRPAMRRSILCDGAGFTRDLEAAFRGMWRDALGG